MYDAFTNTTAHIVTSPTNNNLPRIIRGILSYKKPQWAALNSAYCLRSHEGQHRRD